MRKINILTFGLNTTVSYSVCIPPILMRLDSGFQTLVPAFTDTVWEWKSVIRCKYCSPGKSDSILLDVTVQGYKRKENGRRRKNCSLPFRLAEARETSIGWFDVNFTVCSIVRVFRSKGLSFNGTIHSRISGLFCTLVLLVLS